MGHIAPRVRRLVLDRCGGYSDLSGKPLSAVEVHHRRPGGQGGTVAPWQDSPANLVALLPEEHNMAPGSVHLHAAWSRPLGFLIPHGQGWASDPRYVPIWWRGRAWAYLTDDGGMVVMPAVSSGPPRE